MASQNPDFTEQEASPHHDSSRSKSKQSSEDTDAHRQTSALRLSTRSVITLSAAQLERKRAGNRDARQATYARVRKYMDKLERHEFTSSNDQEQHSVTSIKRKSQLEEDNAIPQQANHALDGTDNERQKLCEIIEEELQSDLNEIQDYWEPSRETPTQDLKASIYGQSKVVSAKYDSDDWREVFLANFCERVHFLARLSRLKYSEIIKSLFDNLKATLDLPRSSSDARWLESNSRLAHTVLPLARIESATWKALLPSDDLQNQAFRRRLSNGLGHFVLWIDFFDDVDPQFLDRIPKHIEQHISKLVVRVGEILCKCNSICKSIV